MEERKKNKKISELGDKIVRGIASKEEKDTYKILVSPNITDLMFCEYCNCKLNKEDLKKHLNEQCKQYKQYKIKTSRKNCPYCNKTLANLGGVDTHVSTKHQDKWKEYIQNKEVSIRIKNVNRCKYCGLFIKKLDEHLKNKCKIYKTSIDQLKKISSTKKEEEIDMSEMKDFKRLEELYGILILKEDRLSLVESQELKNNIKRLESYFLPKEISIIKNRINEKLGKKKVVIKESCPYCNVSLLSKNVKKHLKKCQRNKEKNIPLEVKCQYCNKLIHKDYVKEHHKICSETNCEYCGKKLKKDEYEQHLQKCKKYKDYIWGKTSSIKEIEEEKTILTNIEKHQAIIYQFREDEELDPDLIDEEAYQKTFGIELDEKNKQLRAIVAFEHEKIYKQEEEDKSEIKIFLSKVYNGYCQVCGYTFKKTNGINSFERFNWNDKRVVKVKKSLVSTADSLCLCRNCSANIKWGAFYPNFIDTIREIEKFRDKSYDEIKDKIHKVVDDNIPKIFEPHLEFDDIYALEIELDGKPRNIYFTNEHLLQFITYLQKEDEVEEEVEVKKKRKREKDAINRIYSANSWLKREETIPLDLAESFIRVTANWNHPTAHRYVSAPKHADNIYEDSQHGWALDFGSNSFLVGKAIERCKNSINEYIENQQDRNLTELKESLSKHISGAVATGNNYEYSGYYPIEDGYMKFGVQGIDVEDGVNFLIRRLGLEKYLLSK